MKRLFRFVFEESKKALCFQKQMVIGCFKFCSRAAIFLLWLLPWVFLGSLVVKPIFLTLKQSKMTSKVQKVVDPVPPVQQPNAQGPSSYRPPSYPASKRSGGWERVQRNIDRSWRTWERIWRSFRK